MSIIQIGSNIKSTSLFSAVLANLFILGSLGILIQLNIWGLLFESQIAISTGYRKPGWLWIPGNFDHFKVFFVQPLAELILYNDIEKFYTICKAWLFSMSLSEINSVKECMKKIKSGPSYPVFKVTPVYGSRCGPGCW
jgi:hypothetical protein